MPMFDKMLDAAHFKGLTLTSIVRDHDDGDRIIFTTNEDKRILMHHNQDCCESVTINKVEGNLENLVGAEILVASQEIEKGDAANGYDSETKTTYNFETSKGKVVIVWIGTSNGCYSETVDIEEMQ